MPPVTTADSAAQESASTASMLKERRFKLSRACDRCRRRRIKCDEGHPCQACLAATSACTFEEPGKRTHPHKSKRTATLEDRMHHLETLIQAIPPAIFASLPGATMGSDIPPSSPVAPFAYSNFPSGIPPPSLHVFPLQNPATHFIEPKIEENVLSPIDSTAADLLAEDTSRLSLSASYLYFDDEGYTRWQGETSGLPLLDMLVERHVPATDAVPPAVPPSQQDWFPNRTPRRTDVNPQTLWRLITSYIAPELMDRQLSTVLPIDLVLHPPVPPRPDVPCGTDYGNPAKWGEPGFAAFIVAVCCLASRHMDDPRVRASPQDGISAGTQWFELLGRLRTLPIADRPTLYTIQADLIAAVYAVGLGKLSKAAALLSEAITISIDAGLHRNADTYDLFDPVEEEVRKRTFWCVYIWDKQLGAHFGRPPLLRLRDCDVDEPLPVDDEFISRDGIGIPVLAPGTASRMAAFVASIRVLVVLERVLDVPPPRETGGYLARVAALGGARGSRRELVDEEALLDEAHLSIPPYFAHTAETLASDDTIRLTQTVRLHCAEQFVRLLIYRHRFSELVAERTAPMDPALRPPQSELERDTMVKAHFSALQIIASYLLVAKKGLMTYYGVHVIHQLTQAGRTLVAILLNCKTEDLQPLIPPGLDALRSCVGLLRRFSGRYVCGLRSGDLMEEFCRLTQIPLDAPREPCDVTSNANSRPPWIRPVRKKSIAAVAAERVARSRSEDSPSQRSVGSTGSPEASVGAEAFSPTDFFVAEAAQPPDYAQTFPEIGGVDALGLGSPDPRMFADVLAMFNDGAGDIGAGQLFSAGSPGPLSFDAPGVFDAASPEPLGNGFKLPTP
ncbi:P-type phospholipid transporter [Mycena kentingensis (nom. inval.)]|nr:P-type phospholipid transporter [Mycena kentingensis (nom. inval.)]